MTKEQLIKEFDEKFRLYDTRKPIAFFRTESEEGSKRIIEHPENIKSFLLSAFDAGEKNGIAIGRASGIEEGNRIKKLLEVAKCPDVDCDNNGSITCRIPNDEWEQQQCQWCDEKRIALTPSSSKDN